jgi:hypothetical protein
LSNGYSYQAKRREITAEEKLLLPKNKQRTTKQYMISVSSINDYHPIMSAASNRLSSVNAQQNATTTTCSYESTQVNTSSPVKGECCGVRMSTVNDSSVRKSTFVAVFVVL